MPAAGLDLPSHLCAPGSRHARCHGNLRCGLFWWLNTCAFCSQDLLGVKYLASVLLIRSLLGRGRLLPFALSPDGLFGAGLPLARRSCVCIPVSPQLGVPLEACRLGEGPGSPELLTRTPWCRRACLGVLSVVLLKAAPKGNLLVPSLGALGPHVSQRPCSILWSRAGGWGAAGLRGTPGWERQSWLTGGGEAAAE